MIGVHTPEFSFEHDVGNVRQATHDLGITYPVATDNDYAVWQAFDNHYWPALYVADGRGRIRHHHFGEGEYPQAEMVVQQLLVEAGATDHDHELASVEAGGLEAPADWASLKSAENYTGYERTEGFASPGGPCEHAACLRRAAASRAQSVGAVGTGDHGARGHHARREWSTHVPLPRPRPEPGDGPAAPETPVRFRVGIDGQPPGEAHGSDADSDGNGTLTQQRVYQLIRQPGPVTDRTFEIAFLDPGAQVYCFTFG